MTRAIPVREWRPKGWRTRVVYHYTESAHNSATHLRGRITHQTVECLLFILMMMMRADVEPVMFKRDVRKAFRSIPVMVEHHWCAYVTFAFEGHYYAALQYGMPFGCIAAVMAFHRFGNLLEHVVRSKLKAPMGRYVDDFFGASRKGVKYQGGCCLTTICLWLGIMVDPTKSADDCMSMVVLGIAVTIAMQSAKIKVQIDEQKANMWRE